MTFLLMILCPKYSGHETTAHTLSFIVYSLAKNPDVQLKCQEIIKQINADTTTSPTQSYNPFKLLPDYLEATIKEAMRRYVVSSRGIIRQVDDEAGYDLPVGLANGKHLSQQYPNTVHLKKGTWIMINFFALHNDTNNWGEDARDFKPERWLEPTESMMNLNTPGAYAGIGKTSDSIIFAPFSAGLRNCIGMNMALWELRAGFSRLVSRYHFELADPILYDESKALQSNLTMKPLNQLPVYVKHIL